MFERCTNSMLLFYALQQVLVIITLAYCLSKQQGNIDCIQSSFIQLNYKKYTKCTIIQFIKWS